MPISGSIGRTLRPLVFISHRHEDKALADVISRFIRSGSAAQVDVYQSSDATAERPRTGNYLTDELEGALWRAGRVIFIYTQQDADWGWCLYECGLAMQPNTPPTCVTVFTCGSTAPPQLAGRVVVKIRDRGDVHHFVTQFLTSPDFFPGRDEAVTGFTENHPDVVAAAADLFEALEKIPDPRGDGMRHWPAYPFVQLEIDGTERERLQTDEPYEQRLETAREVVAGARVTDSDNEGARIFGRRWEPDADIVFGDFIRSRSAENRDDAWLEALCAQVLAGARWEFPKLNWSLMRSMDGNDGRLYGPALTRVRRWPDDRMQFDVEFMPFRPAESGAQVELSLPLLD